jgi:hypothetical protein
MPISLVVELDMPIGFNVAAYDSVNDRVAVLANPNDSTATWKRNAWSGYASAWNGLAYRLCSAVEYDESFGRSIKISTAPAVKERYVQERSLFGCVAAALSAIECFYMATYCTANALSPSHFPLSIAKHLNQGPKEVAKSYLAWLPNDVFSQRLSHVANSLELTELAALRNTLAHRGVLPRQHFLSNVADIPSAVPINPKALAEDFAYDAALSSETTSHHTNWLCETSSHLVAEFDTFLGRFA